MQRLKNVFWLFEYECGLRTCQGKQIKRQKVIGAKTTTIRLWSKYLTKKKSALCE